MILKNSHAFFASIMAIKEVKKMFVLLSINLTNAGRGVAASRAWWYILSGTEWFLCLSSPLNSYMYQLILGIIFYTILVYGATQFFYKSRSTTFWRQAVLAPIHIGSNKILTERRVDKSVVFLSFYSMNTLFTE